MFLSVPLKNNFLKEIFCIATNISRQLLHKRSICLWSLVLWYFIPSCSTLLAQTIPIHNPLSIGLRTDYGFIIPHSKSIAQVSNTNPFGIVLDFSKSLISQKSWEKCYCEAQSGFSISHFNFGNPKILGSATSASAYFEPLISAKKKLFFGVRGTFGVTYLSKVFDADHNPDNLFFSMPISFLLGVSFNTYYRIAPQTTLQLGIHYNHISNGGFKQPNKGMNFPTAGIGLLYAPTPFHIPDRTHFTKPKVSKKWIKKVWLLGSMKTVTTPDSLPNAQKPLYGISASIGRQISRYNALNIGFEWVADGFAKEIIKRLNLNKDYHQIGLLLGHELLLGRFIFSQQIAWNAYSPFRTEPYSFYQRYGLSYQFSSHLLVGITLKSYKHIADIFDVRVGWAW